MKLPFYERVSVDVVANNSLICNVGARRAFLHFVGEGRESGKERARRSLDMGRAVWLCTEYAGMIGTFFRLDRVSTVRGIFRSYMSDDHSAYVSQDLSST